MAAEVSAAAQGTLAAESELFDNDNEEVQKPSPSDWEWPEPNNDENAQDMKKDDGDEKNDEVDAELP